MCGNGCKYDWSEKANHCGGRWTLYISYGKSCDSEKSGKYETEESCLSLDGVIPCVRYNEIEVEYLDKIFQPKHGKYSGFTAQII